MLDAATLPLLSAGKNLLAFSAGIDSTALFFLLLHEKIPFDIAHVNYHTRAQSSEEADYARTLAERYGKRCFVHDAAPIGSNFEAEARRVRYTFFESLIAEHGYDTLLTAHQLDDRLEWLFMQLCKGAGLPELLGMEATAKRGSYTLVRPLLGAGKPELRAWLDASGQRYFEDTSNTEERFRRNRFRNAFPEALLAACRPGIKKSFEYLARDAEVLFPPERPAIDTELLLIQTPAERLALMRLADRWLKQKGYLLRQGERERILTEDEVIIGRRYALSISRRFTLLTPLRRAVMPKAFKEQCRQLGIGPGVRPYLCAHPVSFEAVKTWLRRSEG